MTKMSLKMLNMLGLLRINCKNKIQNSEIRVGNYKMNDKVNLGKELICNTLEHQYLAMSVANSGPRSLANPPIDLKEENPKL